MGEALAEAMTLADWRRNASAMNVLGARAKASGLRFAYHNHSAEFLDYDGVGAFGELARLTDPTLVAFELDVGWIAAAGYDPAAILAKYADRVALLHVKDIATTVRTQGRIADDLGTTPIGAGTIDWVPTFAAADAAPIEAWFVEQEPPFARDPLTDLRRSLAYLKRLPV